MEENWIKIYEYELGRDIIEKCKEEDRDIKSRDVENEIHKILKDNQIEFRNRLREEWKPRTGMVKKVSDFYLIVEIYVKENQSKKAEELIKEYLQ